MLLQKTEREAWVVKGGLASGIASSGHAVVAKTRDLRCLEVWSKDWRVWNGPSMHLIGKGLAGRDVGQG